MNLFLSISIGLIFVLFKKIQLDGGLDSITFRLLGLWQLPTVDLSFLGVIIKKMLFFPDFISNQIGLYDIVNNFYKINHTLYDNIIIFLFYFLFSYATIIISKRFYGKDTIIVKIILLIILLTIVYFI